MKIPEAIEIEQTVLRSLIEFPKYIEFALDYLTKDCFFYSENQLIWQIILDLKEKNKPINILVVNQLLKEKNTLNLDRYVTISNFGYCLHSIEFENLVFELIERKTKRNLLQIANNLVLQCQSDITSDLIKSFVENALKNIEIESNKDNNIIHIKDSIKQSIENLEIRCDNYKKGIVTGIMSGFTNLDRITGGWQNSDLIILAARPSKGKTALAAQLAKNTAKIQNKKVLFFSLEMSNTQLVNRYIVGESDIDSEQFRDGNLNSSDWQKIDFNSNELSKLDIYIDDTPAINVQYVKSVIRQIKPDFVIIDYLQLMTTIEKFDNKNNEVGHISKNLKAIAKTFNIPIIALSQLSRDIEKRGNKRPTLSDLRDSGAIEQDADVVIFISNPLECGDEFIKNTIRLVIAKHRSGRLADVDLIHNESYTNFFNDIDNFNDFNVNDYKIINCDF